MAKQILKIGIMSKEDYKKRTIAIAKGEYTAKKKEPKVWFESLQSMAQVLSNENQELLKIIKEQKPTSLKALEIATGRKRSNLSRTLNTMAKYGIVDLIKDKRTVKPVVKATDFKVEFGVNTSFVQ
ncbi:MAG: transcriptional regulator [Desulfobacteraceae bacterium]|uniref:Transcriptional regulator n=1 Tax=Candidatus Desulfaltia bathyphila TaxID=2841697 RepID=A0A8J6T7M8_9BACT|nr:transcriptional regulator [Candidatus Desulfaltia bathyphila]MBL7195855.1 transcriptional regulator [Desulfobacterales bacterium]